ncbi:hypothetical protein VNI00_000697 [Paramarasmius palmivorus]|uniref:F-box domain-containing protein n=1 Tax=Paramarasmius palmivorus TaxID=297713 RepID=A0AAW0E9E2_9AGAR
MERSTLLHEENQLIKKLSDLRTKLNALAPIGVLPPEVLLQILSICAHRTNPSSRRSFRHVMAFSQVCRQWRALALQTSNLWTIIDLCNIAYASTYLTRSGDAHISLVAASPVIAYSESLEKHKSRISSIHAVLFPDNMYALFRSIDASDTVLLSSLTELNLRIPPIADRVDLSCAQTPAVRKLTLEGVMVDWESCQKLIVLKLVGLPATHAPSYRQLFGMFERSPSAKEIHMEDVEPHDRDYWFPSKVTLSRLSGLAVVSKQADSDFMRILQENLIILPMTQVKFRPSGAAIWTPNFRHHFPVNTVLQDV